MADVSTCPAADELARFSTGRLTDAAAAPIEQHIRNCPRCLGALDALKGEDTVVRAVGAGGEDTTESEVVDGLIGKLKGLRPPVPPGEAPTLPPALSKDPPTEPLMDLADLLGPGQGPGRLGTHRLLAVLGQGGMGVVLKAEDPQLQRLVALKVMKPALAAEKAARDRFLLEARATAAIEHDHIVTIHQVGEEGGVPFIAMQFLKGETLDDRLRRVGKLPLPEVLRIGREVAEGLAAAHERELIHRDIKPGNVWLEAGRDRVKILDFGLVRAARGEAHLTTPGTILGTPEYMPPEQVRGEPAGPRSDLFSLGCMLYRMCTGDLPFRGPDVVSTLLAVATEQPRPPQALNRDVPAALSDLILRMLAKDPAGRPDSAQAVAEALRAIEAGATPHPRPLSPAGKGGKGRRRWRAVAAALLVTLGVAGYFVGAAVFRVTTEQGEFTIETDDPQVAVQLNKLGGITLKDQKTGRQYVVQIGRHRLPDGEYDLVVSDPDAGLEVSTRILTIKRGTRPAVKVWAMKKDAKAPAPTAARDAATDEHWSVLVGAKEARYREWEAQVKKDGYRPVSVDLDNLRGKPRYSAIAVKDGKDIRWVVSTITPDIDDDFKKLADQKYRPVCRSRYFDGEHYHVVHLWVKDGGPVWYEWWPQNNADCTATIEEYRAKGFRPSQLKNTPREDSWAFSLFLEPDDGTPYVVRRGASAAFYKAVLDEGRARGFRPISVCAYQEGARLLFDFVLLRDRPGVEWVERHDLSASDYLKEHARWTAKGLRPQILSGYQLNGETRYLAVWLKDPFPPTPAPPRAVPKETPVEVTVLSPGANRESLESWLRRVREDGYRPTFVNGHALKGEARFAAVAVKDGREVEWKAFMNRMDDFQKRFDEMTGKGCWPACLAGYADRTGLGIVSVWTLPRTFQGPYRCWHGLAPREFYDTAMKTEEGYPSNVSAYPVDDGYKLTALFGPGGSEWRFIYGVTPKRYHEYLDEWKPKGFHPATAFVGLENGEPRYGAVLVREPKTEWELRRGLSAADFEKEQRRLREQGYRPELIVGYPEKGESRYLAVWVRPAKSSTRARSGREVPELTAFDEAMEQFMAERNIPAGALAVMKDGKLVLSRGYGFADPQRKRPVAPDAPFRLASLSKPITAAAVHKLIGEGKLKPDTRVAALLDLAPPPGRKMDPRWRDVTVGHLLDHRGGWDSGKSFDPMFRPLEIAAALGKRGPATARDVVRYMAGQPLQFDPGSKSVYSNFGYCLLGRVIEKVTGRTYIDYVRTALLAPLGVTGVALGRSLPRDRAPGEPWYCDPGKGRNVFRPDDEEKVPAPDGAFCLEAMDSHGGLIASAPDVARFLHAYSLDGRPRSKTPGAGCAFGSLPGTFTVALYRADGVEIVALFDQRRDPSGLPYERIREALEKAADGVRHWPAK